MKPGRLIAGLGLLLLLSGQSVLYYGLLSGQYWRHRHATWHRLAEQLPLDELTELRLLPGQAEEWRRIGRREIRFRGEMYDIIRESTAGDTLVLLCLRDERETRLTARLNRQMQEDPQATRQQKQLQDQLRKLLQLNYLPPPLPAVAVEGATGCGASDYFRLPLNLIHPEPPSPPPRSAVSA